MPGNNKRIGGFRKFYLTDKSYVAIRRSLLPSWKKAEYACGILHWLGNYTYRFECKRRNELRDYEQESVSEARELRDYERINEKVYGSNWVNVFDEFMG